MPSPFRISEKCQERHLNCPDPRVAMAEIQSNGFERLSVPCGRVMGIPIRALEDFRSDGFAKGQINMFNLQWFGRYFW